MEINSYSLKSLKSLETGSWNFLSVKNLYQFKFESF